MRYFAATLPAINFTKQAGIDVAKPRLSWVLDSGRQTAYQVVVTRLWDSGKVVSDQSINVEYDGKPCLSAAWTKTPPVRSSPSRHPPITIYSGPQI